jgi:putative membrane protein
MPRMTYAIIAIGCAVVGCSQNNSNDNMAANDMALNDMALNDMAMNDMMMNDMAMNDTTAAGSGVSADNIVDAGFVAEAMKGNNSEVAMGQMAQQMGQSQAVKDYGKMLATDHAAANDQLKALATKAGLPLTDDLTAEAKTGSAKLKALSGAAFDKEFKTMAVADHEKDIAKYEAQAKSPTRDTAAYATATLPTLKKHLEAAKKL